MNPSIRALLGALFLSVAASSAQAQVVLSSLGSAIFGGVTVSGTNYKAQPFATPLTGSYELVSVSLNLANATNTSGNFFVSIMQGDLGTGPDDGLPIITLSGTANPATVGTYTFTANNDLLAANTTYWIVAGVTSGSGSYRWNVATGDNYQMATWTPVDAFAQSSNAGVDWSVLTAGSANPYLYEVTVSAIPEPSTYAALAGLGALGLACWRRRQKTAGAA